MAERRPLIVVPARFSASASALRYRAEVTARALVEAVYAAGGEPVVLHPSAPGGSVDVDEVRSRIAFADGVLLPGGGDVSARWTSAGQAHPSLYDVDEEQDAFDLAVAEIALAEGRPLLSICRGTQIVNVALGGTLVADMGETVGDHRHRVHDITVEVDSPLGRIVGPSTTISCFHHQCLDRLADGLRVAAVAADGVVEAVTLDGAAGWYLGVQWHPEDTAATDPAQAAIFGAFVATLREGKGHRTAG